MKRIIGFITALTLITTPVYASELMGGWKVEETFEITTQVQELVDKATEGIEDMVYEPVGVLGTQVVAGTNYCILSKAHKAGSEENEYVILYIYEDLQGNANFAGTQEIKMELPSPEQEDSSTDQENQTDEPTLGEKNALSSALSYLDFSSFSYTGLIKQLEFEGYSHTEAVYGADNCGADWNEQAAKAAESYLEFTSFSRSGLIGQLEFDGYTAEQAEYGASAVGY